MVKCFSLISLWALATSTVHATSSLKVTAPSGTYVGIINGTTPNVRQFRSIPYAEPPVGPRRWLPPVKLSTNCSTVIDATSFPPSCPQFIPSTPSIFNQDVPEYLIYIGDQSVSAGASAEETSEDCLQLAIWTPVNGSEKLPVILYFTGGGFTVGGINIEAQLPHRWVERTQSHIVVTTNYRLNILGFPNAAALESLQSQNLGILDQRMALGWVRDNIEAFGGDPEKITLWVNRSAAFMKRTLTIIQGQSAGAESADIHNFAFADDPIVQGYFMSSGTALLGLASSDLAHSNFSFAASYLGCGGLNASAELECMRGVPFQDMQNFLGQYAQNNTPLSFSQAPIVPDNKVFYTNYTDRYAKGAYSKLPAIISNAGNEGAVIPPFPPVNPMIVEAGTRMFLCGAANTSALRTHTGSVTYRFEFAGNFTNVSPTPYLGAFHDSDLPYIFGTYSELRGTPTEIEVQVSEAMQDRILAFMTDPAAGPQTLGWQPYAGGRIILFGLDGTVVHDASVQDIEAPCRASG